MRDIESKITPTFLILGEIQEERQRQDLKWGEQNHPDGTGEQYKEVADSAKAACDAAFANGVCTFRHILMEETGEAYAESDPKKLREELIQVAAVAAAWIEAIDRREKKS